MSSTRSSAPRWLKLARRTSRAIGEQARADEHARIVIHVKGRAANFDADGENFSGASAGEDGFAGAEVRHRRAAALTDEVEREDVFPQAELFADVAREAGAKIAGAGADEHGVHLGRRAAGILQRAAGGGRGERGRVLGEVRLQVVGRGVENFRKGIQREVAGVNAVVAAQDFFEDGFGARLELGELGPLLHRVPARALGMALRGNSGAEADDKHPGSLAQVMSICHHTRMG